MLHFPVIYLSYLHYNQPSRVQPKNITVLASVFITILGF